MQNIKYKGAETKNPNDSGECQGFKNWHRLTLPPLIGQYHQRKQA